MRPIPVDEMLWEMMAGGAPVTEGRWRTNVTCAVRFGGGALHACSPWRQLAVEACWRWFRREAGRVRYAA